MYTYTHGTQIRGNHLSNTTRIAHDFFKSGE